GISAGQSGSDPRRRLARVFVAAVLVSALHRVAGLLAHLLDQEGRFAIGAGLVDRPVPEREVAFRIVRAGIERSSLLRPLLGQITGAFRTFYAERDRL